MEMVVSKKEKINRSADIIRDGDVAAVVVAGTASGTGKTSLAEVAIRVLLRRVQTAAAKITVTHGERGCPHGGKGCDVCGTLGGTFQVITRESILMQAGTDTARLRVAGGNPVLWTITRENFIAEAWLEMKRLMNGRRCAVIESNTLALTIKPALTLMIVDPTASRRLWKPSAEQLIAAADILVFNDRGRKDKRQDLLEEVKRLRPQDSPYFVSHPQELEHQAGFKQRIEEVCDGITARPNA